LQAIATALQKLSVLTVLKFQLKLASLYCLELARRPPTIDVEE
jgi:hypothetical protein